MPTPQRRPKPIPRPLYWQWNVIGGAVAGLIFIALACIAGVIVMKSAGEEPPAGLIAIASAAVGALATLLTGVSQGGGER